MLHKLGWVMAAAAVVVGAYFAATAVGHNDSCHQDRSCPSDDHSYEWNGKSCASDPAKRLPEDQTPVDHDGKRYWCHVVVDQGMTPLPGSQPKPPPPPPRASTAPPSGCPTLRASVRTLSDGATSDVRLGAEGTSVKRLRGVRGPANLRSQRAAGAERQLYRVRARLVSAQRAGSGGWQLTIADPSNGATLSVEFAGPRCIADAPAALRTRANAARRALVRACGLPARGGPIGLRGTAMIGGVGFFSTPRARLALRPAMGLTGVECRRR